MAMAGAARSSEMMLGAPRPASASRWPPGSRDTVSHQLRTIRDFADNFIFLIVTQLITITATLLTLWVHVFQLQSGYTHKPNTVRTRTTVTDNEQS